MVFATGPYEQIDHSISCWGSYSQGLTFFPQLHWLRSRAYQKRNKRKSDEIRTWTLAEWLAQAIQNVERRRIAHVSFTAYIFGAASCETINHEPEMPTNRTAYTQIK